MTVDLAFFLNFLITDSLLGRKKTPKNMLDKTIYKIKQTS